MEKRTPDPEKNPTGDLTVFGGRAGAATEMLGQPLLRAHK